MSLDDTQARMQAFAAALARFDESLQVSLSTLNECHAEAEGIWRDAFARDYEAAWAPLSDGLRRWVAHEGPAYRDFIAQKLLALEAYLRGGR